MVPHEVFRYCETKKIEGKPWYAWEFPRSQVFCNLEVVPRNFSRTVRQKFSTEERDFPFSGMESFDTRKFLQGVNHEIFQYCEAKKINGESRYHPIEHKSFRCPKNPGSQRGSRANFIGSKRDINSTEKSDITVLGMKFFDSRTFLIYRSVPQRIFLALWDKKISTDSRDIPFFCVGFFDTWLLKLSETLDGSSRSFSLLWDKKIEGKPWYTKKFLRPQNFWISEVVPRKFLRTVRQKISNEDRDFPFSCIEKSKPEYFRKFEGVRHENFQDCEAKKIKGESRYPATEHKILRCPKDSETKRDSLPSFIGSIREKNSTEKSDITLLGMKFFDSRTFLIYLSVPQRNLCALWAENFSTENRDIPFLFNFFSIPHVWNFLKH